MNRKKRTVAAAVLLVLVLALAASVVNAYLQDKDEKSNAFQIGEDQVTVTETFLQPSKLLQENTVPKTVAVQNSGSSDQYVRVFLDFSDSSVRDQTTILYQKDGSEQEQSWAGFLANLPEDWAYIPESDLTDGALLGGFFYYTKILEPGETTPPLITGLHTVFGGSEPEHIKNFDVIVYSESVQTVEIQSGAVYADTDANAWKAAWRSFLNRTE